MIYSQIIHKNQIFQDIVAKKKFLLFLFVNSCVVLRLVLTADRKSAHFQKQHGNRLEL